MIGSVASAISARFYNLDPKHDQYHSIAQILFDEFVITYAKDIWDYPHYAVPY